MRQLGGVVIGSTENWPLSAPPPLLAASAASLPARLLQVRSTAPDCSCALPSAFSPGRSPTELRTVLRCLPGRLLDGAAHAWQGEAGGRALLVELLVGYALLPVGPDLQAAWPRRDKEGAHVDDQEAQRRRGAEGGAGGDAGGRSRPALEVRAAMRHNEEAT